MEEQELVIQVRNGNQEALARLLHNNYDIVFRYLIKFTLNRITAEDIAQETMLRAIEKFSRYDDEKSKFSTWLITIAQNIYFDQLRKNKSREKFIENGDLVERLLQKTEDYDDSWNRILEALSELKEESRLPIILKHYYGYSYEEIAKKMRILTGTVKSRIHNGLKVLKKELETYE
jgi:RNA polymerase sigma-70 factor, ECF subfamily